MNDVEHGRVRPLRRQGAVFVHGRELVTGVAKGGTIGQAMTVTIDSHEP